MTPPPRPGEWRSEGDEPITRREFGKLELRVDKINEYGTPHGQVLRRDLDALVKSVDKRLANLTRIGIGILLALIGGLISLVTILITAP